MMDRKVLPFLCFLSCVPMVSTLYVFLFGAIPEGNDTLEFAKNGLLFILQGSFEETGSLKVAILSFGLTITCTIMLLFGRLKALALAVIACHSLFVFLFFSWELAFFVSIPIIYFLSEKLKGSGSRLKNNEPSQ